MILTRSPYFIIPTKIVSTTKSVVGSLYLWNTGNKPDTYEYLLYKVLPPRENINYEVSNLIRDKFIYTPIYYTSTGIRKSLVGNVVAVDYYLSYISPVNSESLLGQFALDGYGYFMEGQNPTTPANKILLSNDYYIVNSKGYFNIPVLKGAGVVTINGTSYPYPTGTEVNSQLYNIWINLSNYSNDVTVNIGSTKIYLELNDECKHEPKDIIFLNKWGAWEVMTFFKKSIPSIKTESKEFKSFNRIYQRYNTTARESLEINSGFVPEWYNDTIKQLLMTEHAYIIDNGVHVPINVESSSYTFKTRQTDKLISHNIKLKYAYDTI